MPKKYAYPNQYSGYKCKSKFQRLKESNKRALEEARTEAEKEVCTTPRTK